MKEQPQPMNESDKYILESIRVLVWSGFATWEDVQQMIDDLLEEDANEGMLRSAVDPEFDKKEAAEATWPEMTDCDRLTAAFAELEADGFAAIENAGMTMSDGLDDTLEVYQRLGKEQVHSYCFYHGQDMERAINGGGLMIAFGHFSSDTEAKMAAGKKVCQLLKKHGLRPAWEEDPEKRIYVPEFDWKRRGVGR